MNFLQIAKKDIKNIFKNRFIRVSIIAIIIVPLLYSLLYLDAFWDPYSKINNMPIAVVNLDKGTTLDGSKVNYGNNIIDDLKTNEDVKWIFTDLNDAKEGTEKNTYYAQFIIPEDFSEKIIAAKEGSPQIAELKFVGNDKKNFLASQINRSVQAELKSKVIESISNNYVTIAFETLYDVKGGLSEAADGSKQLNDGINTLHGNVPQLVNGVTELENGSNKLVDGQIALNSGISDVNTGLHSLNNKVPELSSGVTALYNGSTELNTGLKSAHDGVTALSNGTSDLYTAFNSKIYPSVNSLNSGANLLNSNLQASQTEINKLNDGAISLGNASTSISTASSSVKNGYTNIKLGVDELVSNVNSSSESISAIGNYLMAAISNNPEIATDKNIQQALQILQSLQEASVDTPEKLKALSDGTLYYQNKLSEFDSSLQGYTNGVKEFTSGTTTLTSNIGAVSNGVNQLSTGLALLDEGLNENNAGSFGNGLKTVANSFNTLTSGVTALESGANKLNLGLNELNSNISPLSNGVQALYSGSSQLLSGSTALVSGQNQLNGGIDELNSKVPELADGINKLNDGSKELYTALNDGSKEITNGLKNSPSVMGDFVSEPISLNTESINPVPNYGTGFAPYFIPLSLWIGAIMMFFVISSKTEDDENTSKFNKVVGKFLSFGFIGVIQAILVSTVVLMLGLKPTSISLFFITNILLSLVFISIIQCLITLLGDAGRLLAIVLLILQLTACAGTFPLEVVPNFFKVLNPFMPFTYAVQALREVISATTINYSVLALDASILGTLFIIFLTISILFKNKGEKLAEAMAEKKIA